MQSLIIMALLLQAGTYGAQTSADLSGLSVSWGADARAERLRDAAIQAVFEKLLPEVEAMFEELEKKI